MKTLPRVNSAMVHAHQKKLIFLIWTHKNISDRKTTKSAISLHPTPHISPLHAKEGGERFNQVFFSITLFV